MSCRTQRAVRMWRGSRNFFWNQSNNLILIRKLLRCLTLSSASCMPTSSSFSLNWTEGAITKRIKKYNNKVMTGGSVLHVVLLFRIDAEDKLSFLIRLEGRRNNGVHSGRQFETAADFSQVDERRRTCHGRVVFEILHVQRLRCRVWIFQLYKENASIQHVAIHFFFTS